MYISKWLQMVRHSSIIYYKHLVVRWVKADDSGWLRMVSYISILQTFGVEMGGRHGYVN